MQKKLNIALLAMCCAPAWAQTYTDSIGQHGKLDVEAAYTFAEQQLGQNADMLQGVTMVNSKRNVFASEVSYRFAPTHLRFRAYNPMYNEVYINGVLMNNVETGQFRYPTIGGIGLQGLRFESSLPFESFGYGMTALGGSNNYNFRAADMKRGHHIEWTGANRNYTMGGAYSYASGLSANGWAFAGTLSYRWAKQGYVDGTPLKSLSYYLSVQKMWNDTHSLAFATWGSPSKRAQYGASTDEAFLLSDDHQYNPYWGYYNDKKRSSRVVRDFAPTALLTWDWKINEKTRLSTSLQGQYAWYRCTRLNYNGENPYADSWIKMPSSIYNVWNTADPANTADAKARWEKACSQWAADKSNRQLDWERMYWFNSQVAAQGTDAMYWLESRHNDNLNISLATTLDKRLTAKSSLRAGFNFATNKGMHYQTINSLLGGAQLHNVNTYAAMHYPSTSDKVQYDLNNRNAALYKGDRMGYDYNILMNKAQAWASYEEQFGMLNYSILARMGYQSMQRDGKMRNGMAADNSFGKSRTKDFLDGGLKFGSSLDMGCGHTLTFGMGYEQRAPLASTVFAAPEVNNDLAANIKKQQVLSTEVGYMYNGTWLHANLNGYYSYVKDASDWQNFYMDNTNELVYNSITGLKKKYYGLEAGLKFDICKTLDMKLVGTISEAKTTGNAQSRYMFACQGTYNDDVLLSKDMHESGTPLTAASLGVNYHQRGWTVGVDCNYYDRIYLDYSTYNRLQQIAGGESLEQAKGKGGFMLNCSIGRTAHVMGGLLDINLSITNLTNNRTICTGGYESNYDASQPSTDGSNASLYNFAKNPRKFYALGTSGMLNITYSF